MVVARYHRVSTDQQNLRRQTQATKQYVDRLDLGDDTRQYEDASTGTDTDRTGYKELMSDVEAGEIDAVVVKSVSRISRSISDLSRTVEQLAAHDTALHVIDQGMELDPTDSDPYQKAMLQLMGVFAELEAEITQQRVRDGIAARQESDDYHHGRPPLGFNKEDGKLYEAENYHKVCVVLDKVTADEMSKRQAAKELNTSRPTIDRAIEREKLYGL
jgi:DNA invertase Pin-like site-specific DNA recombinase